MIYLLYGIESFLIKQEVNKFLTEYNIDSINLSTYNMEETLLSVILEDAETLSLFAEKKAVLVENSYLFTGVNKKNSLEQNIDVLEHYLDYRNPNTILIFTVVHEKLDKRKKIVKKMKKLGIIKEYNKQPHLSDLVLELFMPYQLNHTDVLFFIDRVGQQLFQLKQEVEKIKIYKNEDLKITREDILNLTHKSIELDIFELIEAIVSNHVELAMELYEELLKQNEEPIKIIIMLANQFSLMYQSKMLYQKGYSEKELAHTLEVHPYRVKLALEKSRTFSSTLLLSYLEHLAQLDFSIKTGQVSKELALELFILKSH